MSKKEIRMLAESIENVHLLEHIRELRKEQTQALLDDKMDERKRLDKEINELAKRIQINVAKSMAI
jgi:predicted amino acid dehydrogenase